MYKEILMDVLMTLLTVTLPILVRYFVVFIDSKLEELKLDKEFANSEIAKSYINLASIAIEKATMETTQTFVDTLKKHGEFNKAAQTEALQKSLEKAKAIMSEETKKFLEKSVGDINAYITAEIESIILQSK